MEFKASYFSVVVLSHVQQPAAAAGAAALVFNTRLSRVRVEERGGCLVASRENVSPVCRSGVCGGLLSGQR